MDKITYLAELAEGLARWVPERERQNILRYYAEYFEEAGPGREAEVIAELGDPWALSCRLAVEGGYVTYEKAASWRPRKRWRRALIGAAVGLSVFSLVYGIGLLGLNLIGFASGVTREVIASVESGVFRIEDPAIAEAVDAPGAMGYYLLDGEIVGSFRSIDADISLGNIEVVSGDDFTLSISRSQALLGYEPELEIRNGVLKLRDGDTVRIMDGWNDIKEWNDLKKLFGVGQLSMDVTITVPDGAGLDSISVKTGLGNVTLLDVAAETVTAETGMGNVECYEVWNTRKLDLETGMGNVDLVLEEVRRGVYIRLESGMGNVEAMLDCSGSECAYELESGLGTVTVNGNSMGGKVERKGSNMLYQMDAESGMGNVNVWFNFD